MSGRDVPAELRACVAGELSPGAVLDRAGWDPDRDTWWFQGVWSGLPFEMTRWKVGPGRVPRWSPDGSELFFRRGQALLAAPVTATGPGRVDTLFSIPSPVYQNDALYAIHPDGERFFMQRWAPEIEATASNRFTVVLDWMEPVSN